MEGKGEWFIWRKGLRPFWPPSTCVRAEEFGNFFFFRRKGINYSSKNLSPWVKINEMSVNLDLDP